MGPMNQPPMVTAQGYTDPMQQTVGAATSPNQMIADLLRRRNAASKQATLSAGNAQMWGNDFQNPQFTQTVDGGRDAPDQVVINWGDILGKGVSNYMGASERKKSVDAQDEVKNINNEFMETTLASDPQAQKLYSAVQAGLPGADKALTDHLAPKKQSMAVLVQGLTSGLMDPQLAEQLAGQYGLDANVVRKAAEYAAKRKETESTDKFSQKVILQDMKGDTSQALADSKPTKNGLTPAELRNLPIEQRIEMARSGGRESQESKERGKLKVQAEQDLQTTDLAIKNTADLINMAGKADYWPGNLGMKGAKMTTNANNAMVNQAIDQLVLDEANGKLGGGVSNADVLFLKSAKTDLNNGNSSTVIAQLNRVLTKMQAHREQLAKRVGVNSPAPSVKTPSSAYDTTATKERRAQSAPDFDSVWQEVGGE